MTAPTSTPPPVDVRLPAACDVCPHSADAHDRIGLRFCQATLDGALPRGCVCPAS